MFRFKSSIVVGAIGLAVLLPSAGVAHAATSYKTLKGPGFSTLYPSTYQTGSLTGKNTFHDADAALFPTLVGVASPDGAASILIGSRTGHDSTSKASTIEKTAFTDLPSSYKRSGSVSQTTKKIGLHSYLVSSDTLVSGKHILARFIYSTTLGQRTFYFFLTVTDKATTAEQQGIGYVLGATHTA